MRADPPHCTTEPLTKLVPVTVRVKADPPAVADTGLRLVVPGTGLLIVKGRGPDVTPPGFNTVTFTVPAAAISAAAIEAVSWVAFTKVVVRLDPPHCTAEPLTKLVPLTVRVNPELPAVVDEGLRLVIVGAAGGLMVNVWALEVPPPGVGLSTVTWAVPAAAISEADIEAVS